MKRKEKKKITKPSTVHKIINFQDYKLIPGKVYPASINHVTVDDDGMITIHIHLEG